MQYIFSEHEKIINASVRSLCEFLYRSGSVYSGGTDVTGAAMLKGTKIHRELQKTKKGENPHYESEYYLKTAEEIDGFEYEVTGFADGLLPNGDGTVIDEFKTTALDLEKIEWDTIKAYSAQIMCYGYMYAYENSLNFVTLRLTYYNYDNDDIKTIEREFTFTELRKWWIDLLCSHVKWAKLVYEHKMKRNVSLHEMKFPFSEYRQGQRELSSKIYRINRAGKRLFAEAPTGIGKTVSTLFPALKALGEGEGDKTFYFSAKNSGSKAAEDTLKMFYDRGAEIKYITLTSKEKICLGEHNCLPSECEFSKGHFDRVNDALYELVSTEKTINKDVILKYAEKFCVCPFELSLDVSEYCDVVVGDYNYGFDPRASLQRYFGEGGDYICLVDEAHNLVDRARDMYSAAISQSFLLRFYHQLKGVRKLKSRLTSVMNMLKKYNIRLEEAEKLQSKINMGENDVAPIRIFCEAYRKFLSEDGNDDIKRNTLELYFELSFFVEIFDNSAVFSEDYIDFCDITNDDIILKLFCANPGNQIKLCTDKMRSCTFFSATMSPYDYYITMLGADTEEMKDEIMSVPSPFPPENMCLVVYKNLSTRLKDREQTLGEVIEIIYNAISGKVGNYFVFFPSYSYMNMVFDEFAAVYPEVKTILQTADMTATDRNEYLKNFLPTPKETLVAFALCGGIFSEGVDLTGDRLSGAVIVGTGLPAVSFDRDLLKEHFDKTIGEGLGYNYAYTYTGLNKVYQAGGRVIRTKEDKGFVLLVDERYGKISHRRTFPDYWKNDVKFLTKPVEVKTILNSFWKA